MTDRPIIFSAPMVQALLAGRKTQTRRLIRLGKGEWIENGEIWAHFDDGPDALPKPYRPGDRLYVREAHSLHDAHGQNVAPGGFDHGKRWGPWSGLPIAVSPDKTQVAYYRQGFDRSGPPKWRPSIHMPRWASRLTLTVTEVRAQRLDDISEADAWAEGCKPGTLDDNGDPFPAEEPHPKGGWIGWDNARDWYADLWESLHGPDAWATNPWVVAVSFTVQHGNIDAVKP